MTLSSISDNNDEVSDSNPQGALTQIQVNAFPPNVSLDDVKATVDTTKIVDEQSMVEQRGHSLSTSVEQVSDDASIQDAANVRVTSSSSPAPNSRVPELAQSSVRSPPSSARSAASQDGPHITSNQRRARHISAIESRPSNRLSGFFSTFMHRRDPTPNPSRELRDGRLETIRRKSEEVPQTSTPPPRPPSLPPPTLQELGLSLSAITTELCPSHFSSPPSSGAFLSPHYLLLCHPQGLDVLPLISPPAIQPYALVRRVNFKSVVVMEQRGVLVTIAGRRDGVRVYALEEIKRAIEWRMEMESRREKERQRRENAKKPPLAPTWEAHLPDAKDNRHDRISSLSEHFLPQLLRRHSQHNSSESHSSLSHPPIPLVPRPATRKTAKKQRARVLIDHSRSLPHTTQPPPYPNVTTNPPLLERQRSYISLSTRPRSHSVNSAFIQIPSQLESSQTRDDEKSLWAGSSDEDAIDAVAAGPSGSHLDERTSVSFSASSSQAASSPLSGPVPVPVPTLSSVTSRRPRPANLNLSPPSIGIIPSESTPARPLHHALSSSPSDNPNIRVPNATDVEDDDDEVDGRISLAQALMESRLPNIPPIGTRQPQEPILLVPGQTIRSTEVTPAPSINEDPHASIGRRNRRRRWSLMINNSTTDIRELLSSPASQPAGFFGSNNSRSNSQRNVHQSPVVPGSLSGSPLHGVPVSTPQTARSSRFLPRILINVFNGGAEGRPPTSASLPELSEVGSKWTSGSYQVPPPKLEYVKLPGTKGAVLIKAVETSKKSFLAILCGDHGEKVELFAGTYRTALGLSRTFILPDSPRSLELQLQGDELVEMFLVFGQNVFGLEPATVRVREVRIGRAERRAARRRVRGIRTAERGDELDDETNVNVSIGVAVSAPSEARPSSSGMERSESPIMIPGDSPEEGWLGTPEAGNDPQALHGEDTLLLTRTQLEPYTSFQQLNFAPKFPLASIADDYVIPPTYPDVLDYKSKYEAEDRSVEVQEQAHLIPPGLPVPIPTVPSRWFYRDPKNVIHGPWKALLMQAWYRDGLLPPDLPVKREEETEFILLCELRLRCIDPMQPFRNTALLSPPAKRLPDTNTEKPLLSPISLLTQPKHFGPPALFYSSRGGHSTAIVDPRGRSILKGKFFWSADDSDESPGKLGDIKRLEVFDISERSLLVAFRRGGLEVVDFGDALLNPADESRMNLPNYTIPLNAIGRRAPFIWKIGNSLSCPSLSLVDTVLMTTDAGHPPYTKSSVTSAKYANGKTDSWGADSESDQQDVLFLGRNEDDVFFCERNLSSFRIIRLSPIS